MYLVSGLGLGVGIALRPVFSKIMSGAIFDATHVMNATEVEVCGNSEIKGKIVQVGLLHTWLQDGNNLFMVGNKYLEENPVKITLSGGQLTSLGLKQMLETFGTKPKNSSSSTSGEQEVARSNLKFV